MATLGELDAMIYDQQVVAQAIVAEQAKLAARLAELPLAQSFERRTLQAAAGHLSWRAKSVAARVALLQSERAVVAGGGTSYIVPVVTSGELSALRTVGTRPPREWAA